MFQINATAAGIYLGSFTPKNNEEFNFMIPLHNVKGEVITIYTANDYFRSESKKIGAVNLKLLNRERAFPLSKNKLNLETNRLLYNQSLNFQLNLRAEYEPGLYKNIIYLVDDLKVEELEIVFEIRPWREILNGTVQNAKINNLDDRTMDLLSSGQQKILIRSNTDWKLKVLISETAKDNLSIKIAADSESRKVVNYKLDFTKLNETEAVIASGTNTAKMTSGQAAIYYQLRIEDFRKVNAGEKDYQINFALE
jgi:hypothetical protein